MIFLAWFSLLLYTFSVAANLVKDIQKDLNPLAIALNLAIQSCIIWCLITLVLIL
jgi:hypothetical protein